MTKKRVHEVAKEINMGSKELLKVLTDLGVAVKSHMSTLDPEDIVRLREHLNPGKKGDKSKVGTAAPEERAGPAGQPRSRGVKLSQYGPGLVDKVPQRPPDKRLIERPFRVPTILPPASGEEAKAPPPAPPEKPVVEAPPREARPAPRPAAPAPQPERHRPARPLPPRPAPERRPPPSGSGARPSYAGRPQPGAPRPPHAGGGAPRPQAPAAGRYPGPPRPAQGARPPVPGRPPQHRGRPGQAGAGTPHPGPGAARPLARGIPSKAIPKPPAELEAAKPDKSVGQQRFADKKEKDRRTHWDKNVADKESRFRARPKERQRGPRQVPPSERKPVVLTGGLTVKDLAERMGVKSAEIIKQLMFLGSMATINQEIDVETAVVVAEEMGFRVEVKERQLDLEELLELEPEEEEPEKLQSRPPVVTILGHVDHGKTSLLDAIRDANVTATEAGGITQHIGAYQVKHQQKRITFLDTPGHEAFTAMRARGARITDVAILVVAADDGVKPQTVEAINHAKAAGVPIIVAINKIDKPDANPEKVKQQLTEYGLVAEEWGGDTICVPVSALQKTGLEELLEMILLVAEVNELKANPFRSARGTVIESQLDKGRGPVVTVLVENGTVEVGDSLVAGNAFCRVRAMIDHKGRRVKKAGPSAPVEVLGFSEVPQAGERFYEVPEEKVARQIAMKRQERKRQQEHKVSGRISLEDVFRRIQEGTVKELPLIVKADVQGSAEAMVGSLQRLSTEEVKVQLIHQGVGAVTESDVNLAALAGAIIIGFNVRPDVNARKAAEKEQVDIRLYQVIYEALDDVKAALSGLLEPTYREVILGHAEVRQIFKVSRVGTIAGCYVLEGKITRDAGVRVIRDGKVVHDGRLSSLKRFKDDVREVVQGYECGLTLEKFNDVQEGDQLEFHTTEEIQREL
ncbi:MAG: translation initiation factor IF-2 [Bacillota bacterium]